MLVTLVEAWERQHYPLDLPDPVEAIKYHMDQTDLSRATLFRSLAAVTAPEKELGRYGPVVGLDPNITH